MAINNKYKRWNTKIKVNEENILDFVLSQDGSPTIPVDGSLTTKCLISNVDLNNPECVNSGISLSSDENYVYEEAINDGVVLEDIGITGLDNGLIEFDKDTITDEEYKDLLFNSVMEIDAEDYRLVLDKVNGNTKRFDYFSQITSQPFTADTATTYSYVALKGGFYQGFFKLDGFDYQVLPNVIKNTWNLEFVMRPKNYKPVGNTVNDLYPENKGIFFFIGTRAENKFSQFYGDALSGYPRHTTSVTHTSDEIVNTNEGDPFYTNRFYRFETDNKHLFFNRTKNGYTVDTWTGTTYEVTGLTPSVSTNQYLLFNRTKSGYTTDEIIYSEVYNKESYNIIDDITGNAFALKVNDDGSIGYRYLVKDCSEENRWNLIEEYSRIGIVKKNRWNVVNVMFSIVNGALDKCEKPLGERLMRIYIYVNGYLKMVSRELPEFNFRRLNDNSTKQEAVPYNISLGGGTLGLLESMWEDRHQVFPYILPLEENFCGTFIGDIKSFKFYDCKMQYNEIKNNYLYEIKGLPNSPYLEGLCLCFDVLDSEYDEFIENVLTIENYLDTKKDILTYQLLNTVGRDIKKSVTIYDTPEYQELYYMYEQSRLDPEKEIAYNGQSYEHIKTGDSGNYEYWRLKYLQMRQDNKFSTVFLLPSEEKEITKLKIGTQFATDMLNSKNMHIDNTSFEGYTVYRYQSDIDCVRTMMDKSFTYIVTLRNKTE